VRELTRRGLRVGTVKHTHHAVQPDQPGKDTWDHAEAGARSVVLAGPGGLRLVRRADGDPDLEQALALFQDIDIVIVEGYKNAQVPKVEVLRKEISTEPLGAIRNRIAFVADFALNADVPVFRSADTKGLVSFLVRRFMKDGL